MAKIEKGDYVKTPRFMTVTISDVLTKDEARVQGFIEPTHYWDDPDYDILGKHTGINRMIFAAVIKS